MVMMMCGFGRDRGSSSFFDFGCDADSTYSWKAKANYWGDIVRPPWYGHGRERRTRLNGALSLMLRPSRPVVRVPTVSVKHVAMKVYQQTSSMVFPATHSPTG